MLGIAVAGNGLANQFLIVLEQLCNYSLHITCKPFFSFHLILGDKEQLVAYTQPAQRWHSCKAFFSCSCCPLAACGTWVKVVLWYGRCQLTAQHMAAAQGKQGSVLPQPSSLRFPLTSLWVTLSDLYLILWGRLWASVNVSEVLN